MTGAKPLLSKLDYYDLNSLNRCRCRLCAETAGSRTSLECHFLTQLPSLQSPTLIPDGPGLNYIVTHDLALPPMNWASSTTRLYSQGAKSKLGECRDFDSTCAGTAQMEGLLHHTRAQADGTFWLQDKMRSARRPPHRMLLPKTAHGGVNYMSVGGEWAGGPVYRWIA
ncbi:hypothetical protein B0H14DRAFT_2652450 [Mycena olivaceomarginata]|nr:hypothetical protein B0H14DRAFT_2652450 [Mycena olivaceomarginata]